MHAVTIVDGALEWREHDDPVPGTGELLIAVRAAGINGGDLMQVAGFYPAPPGAPADIPGLETTGEVIAVGPRVGDFAVGDRVMAVVAGGGQAERAVVHERVALRVPDDVAWAAAGGFAETFTTAHDALFTQAGLAVGERVCIHGAAGGVGSAAVQVAVAAGATVVATVRSPELHEVVAGLGATVVAPDDFVGQGPFDVVLELIGGPNVGADLEALAIGGRIAVIGVGAGARAELDLLGLMAKRGRIHGSTLRPRPLEGKAAAARAVERHVLPLLEAGTIGVPIAATFPLSQAAEGYERFRAGNKFGKVVLTSDA